MKQTDLRYEGQNIKEWADIVANFEYSLAKNQLAKGTDVEEILSSMSYRIASKMIHPVLTAVKEQYISQEINDPKLYKDKFLDNRKPIADHVSDDW